jgi:hypothetical protein
MKPKLKYKPTTKHSNIARAPIAGKPTRLELITFGTMLEAKLHSKQSAGKNPPGID